MPASTIRNVIAWNRTALRRATRYLERAKNDRQRTGFRRDLARYQANIDSLMASLA